MSAFNHFTAMQEEFVKKGDKKTYDITANNTFSITGTEKKEKLKKNNIKIFRW